MSTTVHVNPFSGICIHGVEGACLVDNAEMKAPMCSRCYPKRWRVHDNFDRADLADLSVWVNLGWDDGLGPVRPV